MGHKSIYYWGNFISKNIEQGVKPNSFIVNFYIVNQDTNDICYKWYSFDIKEEVINFIKYIVLPSGYY